MNPTAGNELQRARAGARLAAALYVLCGAWVAVAGPLLPAGQGFNRLGLGCVGVVAMATGLVIWRLPWERWRATANLWVVPVAFALIGLHNRFSGNDGYRSVVFFMVAFAWVGMVHRPGTSLRFLPLAAAAMAAPIVVDRSATAAELGSVVYVLPACVLVGETVGWVAERLRRAERHVAQGEATFRMLFADNPQPMWVYDTETLAFLEVNEAAVAHYGYPRERFLAMTIADIRPPEDVPALLSNLQGERSALQQSGAWRHVRADGRVIDVDITSHRLSFEGRDAALVAVIDVTDRNRLEGELRHQASHDSLTHLANRDLFRRRVAQALDTARRHRRGVAVLFVDLDDFKAVNDSAGHVVGDRLLVAIAKRLRATLRDADTVARLGGDEFGILVEEGDQQRAVELADRLRVALAAPFSVGSRELTVRTSIGIAVAERGAEAGADELLRDADVAMYAAKGAGKDRYRFFEPPMRAALLARMELEADLGRAVGANEFVCHFQPIVSLAPATAGQVVGAEALLRWHHPTRGLLLPGEFLAVAEETGLVAQLGSWVLSESCRVAAGWPRGTGRSGSGGSGGA
ncbi:MAG: diguanylate cyclase, partial [Acidimicrobiia bacterium]|nr:diguanylate cyclase [Acidimicrobiia bacterium]